ncbi:TPA: LysM peptidoglycan-binding domain-containing protein [Vibrio parahaemolyticus]|uniref:LysM peptidoglycan-binding domain-containing protein n=1 Tax=Vibrio parahaemolyticus TaxID=670 RepID=UPI00063EAB4A|nr:LysM peptidoglycan-binding domain-containing protein [Vibrio parahaemolyticus]KLI83278.1 peptidoglycan-binding protein [Vibrio parahaemolyticus]HAS6550091.1 LysM peptidoglycan-binding domain-containing protein [Vibrio parahaemolyticus]HAS6734846.1 LysM peptidoglycan-binding domain-containing protein [Vibrio parahaemolyticus]HAS6847197.1 LysM peptidoglycan-binding domain-containing protein [Vibrio parahaemolyticus]
MNRIFRNVASVTLPLLFSFNAAANVDAKPLTVKDDAPQTYVVVKGDTLWDISAMYLDSPWLWPRLWQVNPDIDNPHLIYPGDKLSLVWINGQPVLSLKPVKKLSPKARITEKKAVPTVAEGLVMPYLKSDRLLDQDALNNAAKVMGSSKGSKYLTAEDVLYIDGKQTATGWAIYRPVETFSRDDVSKEITALRLIAKGELVEASSDYSGLKITSQLQEILRNDIALPNQSVENTDFTTTFYPMPSPQGSSAKLLGNIEGIRFSSTNQVVVIDKGTSDSLKQGSVFDLKEDAHPVYKDGDEFKKEFGVLDKKITLPQSKVGELLVIRPYEYFSLALITTSTKPINKEVSVVSPLTQESTTNEATQ